MQGRAHAHSNIRWFRAALHAYASFHQGTVDGMLSEWNPRAAQKNAHPSHCASEAIRCRRPECRETFADDSCITLMHVAPSPNSPVQKSPRVQPSPRHRPYAVSTRQWRREVCCQYGPRSWHACWRERRNALRGGMQVRHKSGIPVVDASLPGRVAGRIRHRSPRRKGIAGSQLRAIFGSGGNRCVNRDQLSEEILLFARASEDGIAACWRR